MLLQVIDIKRPETWPVYTKTLANQAKSRVFGTVYRRFESYRPSQFFHLKISRMPEASISAKWPGLHHSLHFCSDSVLFGEAQPCAA